MAPSTAASSSSAQKPNKRAKWSREQLLKSRQQIQELLRLEVLPAELPPSPPSSRPASPVPSSKRKLETPGEQDISKRPRTTSLADRSRHQHQASTPPTPLSTTHPHPSPHPSHNKDTQLSRNHISRSEPCEDGELREDLQPPSSSHVLQHSTNAPNPQGVPIRRPKRGKGSQQYFNNLHDKYHNAGRIFKYSGDARFWSTYPSTNKEYRPLPDPPSPHSPYHKHGGLIARLELLDALLCFTYAIWCKDQSRGTCIQETWRTTMPFLDWCKQKWMAEDGNDAEKAFIGLIWMIEGFIHARLDVYATNSIAKTLDDLQHKAKSQIHAAAENAGQLHSMPSAPRTQSTPPMLPSPASLGAPNSNSSTPTNRDGSTSTPSTHHSGHPTAPPTAESSSSSRPPQNDYELPVPRWLLPSPYKEIYVPSHILQAVAPIQVPVKIPFIHQLRLYHSKTVAKCLSESQAHLTLPTMARFFPTTFARMAYSTLSINEEYEPDMEDQEGELFWPGQCVTGESLGWVCLMGKAMVNEYGKNYSYRGIDGVVQKPDLAADASQPHRQGTAPSHHSLPQRPVDINRG